MEQFPVLNRLDMGVPSVNFASFRSMATGLLVVKEVAHGRRIGRPDLRNSVQIGLDGLQIAHVLDPEFRVALFLIVVNILRRIKSETIHAYILQIVARNIHECIGVLKACTAKIAGTCDIDKYRVKYHYL